MLHSVEMPNFPPLRRYVFSVVDRWIARHGLESPFLEVGCGTGDLAVHLAGKGWTGTAFDSSAEALSRARQALAPYPGIRVVADGLAGVPDGAFRTVFLMDVLEHVQDDAGLLRTLAGKLAPGGSLVLLTPVNPGEWGHDDDIYGHFRRYGWEELADKLAGAGLARVEQWNVTVPFIWALRRLYLRALPGKSREGGQDSLTAASSFYNPWSQNALLRGAGALLGLKIWWAPLFWLQDRFNWSTGGHAAMFLARKRDT
jgi:SAM-dependent methyltransferase